MQKLYYIIYAVNYCSKLEISKKCNLLQFSQGPFLSRSLSSALPRSCQCLCTLVNTGVSAVSNQQDAYGNYAYRYDIKDAATGSLNSKAEVGKVGVVAVAAPVAYGAIAAPAIGYGGLGYGVLGEPLVWDTVLVSWEPDMELVSWEPDTVLVSWEPDMVLASWEPDSAKLSIKNWLRKNYLYC
ncbi:hypothetical protein CEXT_43301 [Caerostris extrusa]|uniref:Uncharacterized protein n=1 Tax=Caerostris extrusa TaxID=172846 RepID=A0AAV4N671_CAEEX|nr:hypothetical protein CEXT_43301 [Caerostris extrusa]